MQLVPIQDTEILLKLLKKDDIYKTLCNTNDITKVSFDFHTQHWMLVIEEQQLLGLMIFSPFTYRLMNFHFGLYKDFRSMNTVFIIRQCLEKAASDKDIIFMTTISDTNKKAMNVANKLGLQHIGVIKGGYSNSDMNIYSEV